VRLSITIAALGVLALAAGAACSGDDGGDSGKVKVVTTLPLFADFVREVGGDRVEVTALLPSGTDPHTWEPSPSDVKKVAEADIAFANGMDLEPSAIRLIETNLKDGAPFVKLGEHAIMVAVPAPHGSASGDPHYWMDPYFAQVYAGYAAQGIIEVDPENKTEYESREEAYRQRVDDIEGYVAGKVAALPENRRRLATTHDAFGHFAGAFRMEVVAVVAESPGQEPSPEDVADLARAIEDEGVPAVFREPQIDAEGRILEQAAKDAGVQVCTLYSDSLDDKVKTYIEMMRFNADEIARCLGGDVD
jgi:ABC-type Zn uptake system ZnuABC Zn-binding protein ZnuA